MTTLRVGDILTDKILVSRESAHLLQDAINTMLEREAATEPRSDSPLLAVDFAGVAGVAPSFLDELLSIFESVIHTRGGSLEWALLILNPPARLSSKFEAVARGHGLSAKAQQDGAWLLTAAPPASG